jgi:hypothetical protein
MPTLCTPLDNVRTNLKSNYNPGDLKVSVLTGTAPLFGSPSPTAPVRITLIPATNISNGQIIDRSKVTSYRITGITGDDLTGLVLDSGTDQPYNTGDVCAVLITAKTIAEIHAAIPNAGSLPGLGTAALLSATDVAQVNNNLSDLTDKPAARAALGLDTAATHPTAFFCSAANNLSELADKAAARATLGLGSAATHDTPDFISTTPQDNPSYINSLAGAKITGDITGSASFSAIASAVGLQVGTRNATQINRDIANQLGFSRANLIPMVRLLGPLQTPYQSNYYETGTSKSTIDNATISSTFTGWAGPVGILPVDVNTLIFRTQVHDKSFPSTYLRVRVRDTNSTGTILADTTIPFSPAVNVDTWATICFGKSVGDGVSNRWVEWYTDGRIGVYFTTVQTFPTTSGYPQSMYSTTGSITNLSLAVNSPNATIYTRWVVTGSQVVYDSGAPSALAHLNVDGPSNPGGSTFFAWGTVLNASGSSAPARFNLAEVDIYPFAAAYIPTQARIIIRVNNPTGAILGDTGIFLLPSTLTVGKLFRITGYLPIRLIILTAMFFGEKLLPMEK